MRVRHRDTVGGHVRALDAADSDSSSVRALAIGMLRGSGRCMIQTVTAAKKLTVDDLYARGEDIREELLHGEIVSKAFSGAEHQTHEGALLLWAARRFNRNAGGRWPGGWWILAEIHTVYDTHEVFCHDIAGWRREDRRGTPRTANNRRQPPTTADNRPGLQRNACVANSRVLVARSVRVGGPGPSE